MSNAGAFYAQFRVNLAELDQIDWEAVSAADFRDASVKEKKQAEFLVYESVPWDLVSRIGVYSPAIQSQVMRIVQSATHRPEVTVKQDWYF